MSTPEMLYHYTSLETLALILEHRTIRLMPLSNMDDKQESVASDVEKMGQFYFVSCWTADNTESIPMWNMYAGLCDGVRIGMPVNPFVKYSYSANEIFHFDMSNCVVSGDPESYVWHSILPPKYFKAGAFTTSLFEGTEELIKITYTDKRELLEPQIVTNLGDQIGIATNKLGRFKNKYWEFQKEYRYILEVFPPTLGNQPNPQAIILYFTLFANRLANDQLRSPFNYIDLDLRPDALDKLEVMFSPGMTPGNTILAKTLLGKYGLSDNVRTSALEELV